MPRILTVFASFLIVSAAAQTVLAAEEEKSSSGRKLAALSTVASRSATGKASPNPGAGTGSETPVLEALTHVQEQARRGWEFTRSVLTKVEEYAILIFNETWRLLFRLYKGMNGGPQITPGADVYPHTPASSQNHWMPDGRIRTVADR